MRLFRGRCGHWRNERLIDTMVPSPSRSADIGGYVADSSQMVRSYVESLIEAMTGIEKATPDEDGDYAVRFGDALYYVSVLDSPPIVHVFSLVLTELAASAALLRKINEINARLRFCRMYHEEDRVVVVADSIGMTLDEDEFRAITSAVATASDYFGPIIAAECGGKLEFEAGKGADYKAQPGEHTGMYV
jgi:hypothetical protein